MNKIKKLLIEITNKMESTSNKKIDIWTRTKTPIKRIEIKETSNKKG